MNNSITFLNVDDNILYTEGNGCGIIDIPVIEITFENVYIFMYFLVYIYGYLKSKLIGSEATAQIII